MSRPAGPPSAATVLAALRSGDDSLLRTAAADEASVEPLVALASDPEAGAAFAALERPNLEDGAHPVALLLHTLARLHRYDPATRELGGEFLEALAALLDEGYDHWSEVAATEWSRWLLYQSEAGSGWRHARTLLRRRAATTLPPGVCSALAMVAERSGATSEAVQLWELARSHPSLVDSARRQATIDHAWASTHLMLSAGAPSRAVFVQERAQATFATLADESARLARLNAAMECAFAAVVAGQPELGIAGSAETMAAFADDPPLGGWLAGVRALPLALLGELDAAGENLERAGGAVGDTSTLELAATLPAKMVLGARRGDRGAVEAAVSRALALEHQREPDDEQAVTWRLFAVLAWLVVEDAAAARQQARDLHERFATQRVVMPVQQAHADLLAALARGDDRAEQRARTLLARHGVLLAPRARDVWGLLPADSPVGAVEPHEPAAVGVLRIEVLDGLRLQVDGEPVHEQQWGSRRKARTALALLAAHGGRMQRDTLVEALWGDDAVDPTKAGARLSTILTTIRSVLGAARAPGEGARALVLRDGFVELQLAPDDHLDTLELERAATAASAVDPRDDAAHARLAETLLPMADGEPLRGLDADAHVTAARDALVRQLHAAITAVARGWLAATEPERLAPPAALLALVEHAVRLDPLDEVAATFLVELLHRAGRVADASRAFHRVRERLAEALGLDPCVELVRAHERVVRDQPPA